MKNRYIVEMTDTFGGEANYCWVNRFIVTASTHRGAMRKVSRETRFAARCTMPGDPERWDAVGACVCWFVEFATDLMVKHYLQDHSNVKEL
jgi:hypothetical protein